MLTFATEYYITVLVASVGVIQVGASVGRLAGLLVIKSPIATRALGVILIVAAFIWFFSSENRNINDHMGGLDGPAQALLFFLGSITGIILTLVVSSLVNLRMKGVISSHEAGLDALKNVHYIRALSHNLGYWRKEWRAQMKRYFFG